MGALKVWTGSQWTEAGGGLRDVPAGVVGASVYLSADSVDFGTAYAQVPFDGEFWDTDGIHASGVFTVPAGMGGRWLLTGSIEFSQYADGDLVTAYARVNGAWQRTLVRCKTQTAGASDIMTAHFTEVLDLDAGDTVEIWVQNDTTATWDISGHASGLAATRAQLVKLGSGTVGDTIGAKVYNDGVVANSAVIPFDAELWDTDGFHDNATNNSRVTIPAGLAGKYLVQFTSWVSATTTRPEIYVNGSIAPGRGSFGGNSGTANYIGAVGVYDLAAGDYVEIFHNGSGTVGDAGTQGDWAVLSVTLLATTGADPGRVRTGTAFPTPGAAWTDRFVRTDLDGIEFTHDGTRWVTTEMFKWVCGSSALTVDTFISRACVHSTLDVFIESMESTVFTTTALSPTNSAGVVLSKVDTANSTTEVARETYESGGSSAWTSASTAVGASVDTSAYPVQLRIDYDETGTVSSLAVEVAVYYRLIAT